MASSNRHWPSMFKSKPCSSHHQWQHDINHPNLISSTGCHRSPYSSVTGCEERSPEPKPRWNPKPEQIRILEGIFNSGIVNPPREEIRKIRAQLQEYGQVGDANVFYWFQNRKSRSKHKLRHLQNAKNHSSQPQNSPPITALSTPVPAAPSSSSSSSDKTSPKSLNKASMAFTALTDLSNSPSSASVSQTSFHAGNEFLPEPFFFPSSSASNFTQGFCFSELSNMVHHHQAPDHGTFGPCTSLLLSDIINHGGSKKDSEEKFAGKIHPQLMTYPALTTHSTTVSPHNTSTTVTVPSPINQIQVLRSVGDGRVHGYSSGHSPLRLTKWPRKVLVWHSLRNDRVLAGLDAAGGDHGHGHGVKATVFINDVAFEVPSGPLNVREAFGDDAVLIHSSGQPILTNEWGITLQSLSHGSSYYLI